MNDPQPAVPAGAESSPVAAPPADNRLPRASSFRVHPSGPPGGFEPPPQAPGRSSTSRTQRPPKPVRKRRHADTFAAGTLALSLPWLGYSVLVVSLAGYVVGYVAGDAERIASNVVIAWLVSGVLIFFRPVEVMVARIVLRARRPTENERRRLDPAWQEVTTAAGVKGRKYRLWIEDTDTLNAYATSGHIVTVTRQALDSMRPNQLAAVLAHELGHHIGGHSWANLLTHWYALPARLFTRVLRVVIRVAVLALQTVVAVASRAPLLVKIAVRVVVLSVIPLTVFFIVSFVILSVGDGDYWVPALVVALLASPLLLAWLARRSEFRADRFAADLGFGRPLIEVFEDWLRQGVDDGRSNAILRARLFNTHPALSARINKLSAYLAKRAA